MVWVKRIAIGIVAAAMILFLVWRLLRFGR